MVGIGFAFTENILYLTSAYMGQDGQAGGIGGAVGLFIVRCIFGPFAHPFFTAFTGIGIGIAVTARASAVRVFAPLLGYVVAVGAHAAWNSSLMLDDGRNAVATYVFLMVPAFLLLTGFAIWSRRREGAVLTTALERLRPARVPRPRRDPVAARASPPAASRGATPSGSVARPRAGRWWPTRTRPWSSDSCTAATCAGYAPPDFARIGQEHVDTDARAAARDCSGRAGRRPASAADACRPAGRVTGPSAGTGGVQTGAPR